jgi:superfamily II DNA or RNA helicase
MTLIAPANEGNLDQCHSYFSSELASQPPWPHQSELIEALSKKCETAAPGARLLVRVATGGGKRRIFNDFIERQVLSEGKRALVVTKDWFLLEQAARDLLERHHGVVGKMGYVGDGGGRSFFRELRPSVSASIIYTTIQTWTSRADREFANAAFDCVIIDELHWGEGAPSYDLLLRRYKERSVFIGVTATPRKWTSFELVGRPFDFAEMVEAGILARPVVFSPTATGVDWSPEVASERGDFSQRSLNELASSSARDAKVVETYVSHQRAFGKTIVFACNIDHAVTLARRFSERNIPAQALHSRLSPDEQDAAFRAFQEDRIDVLVNVSKLTTGVDIPEIRTVFLARPTTSDILFAQMIGRASRLAPGKRFFTVVDFVDNVPAHGVPPIRPDGFFGTHSLTRSPPLAEHVFAPAEFVVFPLLAGYEGLSGLELHPSQTFGVEFELSPVGTMPSYRPTAARLLEALRHVVPAASEPCLVAKGRKDNRCWNVEPDASCGFEITSRILLGERGFMEVVDACKAIEPCASALGLRVSVKTGTHIHLGWRPGVCALRRLMEITAYYEPALLSLVAPSRATNQYASSVRRSLRSFMRLSSLEQWRAYMSLPMRRYLAVNPANLFWGYGTVEVRMHSGTIDALKILTWISLWMRIHQAAGNPDLQLGNVLRRVPSRPLCTGPRGDILSLANLVGAGGELTRKLIDRRRIVVSRSWATHSKYGPQARRLLAYWNADASTSIEELTPTGLIAAE